MENNILVAPSILGVSEENLHNVVTDLINADADLIHFDVMDGKFVSNTSFTGKEIDIVGNVLKTALIDVHLMVNDVKDYIDKFTHEKVMNITFHYEATKDQDINALIDYVHSKKIDCGLSVSPDTPVEVLKPYLDKVELVLIMSVVPGKGGQQFLDSALDKIEYLKRQKEDNNYNYVIEVDGGINEITSQKAKKAGAQILVAGSYILKSDDYSSKIRILKR